MAKYRKKPVVIEAVQWAGTVGSAKEMEVLLGDSNWQYYQKCILIDTLKGSMTASIGDWIIKGIKGEFYPCKPDIFEATYELVE
jgi:hypothetical protein